MWELNKCILELFLHWYSLNMYIWFISLATKTTKHVHLWQWWANSPCTPFLEVFCGDDIRAIVKSCFCTMDATDPNPSQDSNVQRRRRCILFFLKRRDGEFWWGKSCHEIHVWLWGYFVYDILLYYIIPYDVNIISITYDYNISYIIFIIYNICIYWFADAFPLFFVPVVFFWSHQGLFYCWMILVGSGLSEVSGKGTSWVAMKPSRVEHLLLMAEILHQLRLVVYPIIYRVVLHPTWLLGISSIKGIKGFFSQ